MLEFEGQKGRQTEPPARVKQRNRDLGTEQPVWAGQPWRESIAHAGIWTEQRRPESWFRPKHHRKEEVPIAKKHEQGTGCHLQKYLQLGHYGKNLNYLAFVMCYELYQQALPTFHLTEYSQQPYKTVRYYYYRHFKEREMEAQRRSLPKWHLRSPDNLNPAPWPLFIYLKASRDIYMHINSPMVYLICF